MLSADKHGKYPVQVRFSKEDYMMLREEAFKNEMTVNEFVRVVSLDYARASRVRKE